jgi:hypothetical protein
VQSALQISYRLDLTRYQAAARFVETSRNTVLDVAVNSLPMPDESVAWQQIQEFRSDPDARLQLLELRAWMRKVAAANTPVYEIREEIETLRAAFEHAASPDEVSTRMDTVRGDSPFSSRKGDQA